ncbi:MAG TPA: bifunctional phosphoglucose/phosphomannose isomerase [Candidatus Saccharimonadales bacterium]|nr:bifunctional phosphoglucose/phosphomannose isomerase [Candidatus Saccharimonadales bacterium]
MLDDLKYIHKTDAVDTLGIAERQAKQLLDEFTFAAEPKFGHVYNVVFAGMGGSALAAEIARVWPGIGEPFEIVRGYDIPKYVDGDTLFIASSYSGNTEETLSALEQAEAAKAQIVVIAAGGKLQEIARAKGYPFMLLPRAEQPRYAVLDSLKATLTIFAKAGLIKAEEVLPQLAEASAFLQTHIANWRADVPTASNPAKQLAHELMGKSVVVYAGPKLWPAAYKWKISCNENAKQIAWTDQLPEFNHNEFIGWSKQPVQKPYAVVDLRSNLEHPRVQKRFEVTARLLSGMRPEPHVVQAEGETLVEQLLWTIAFGDFVTLYLALLNGLNPAPVDLVEAFKKALDD